MAGYFTALGLSTAAGLNAYIPLLTVGLLNRYTDLIDLPAPWDNLGDPLILGIVGVVGVADFIGDKVPIVDHVLHVFGLAVAPVVGGLLALASASAFDLDPSVTAGLGVGAALATQVGRTAARPVSTAVTGGGGNPVVSLGEDGVSGALAFTAVVWPVVAAVLAAVVLVAVFVLWRKWRSFRSRFPARGRSPGQGTIG
ncbi:MAG: DUF4126 domain-containing protein [Actinomycetota bacterium]